MYGTFAVRYTINGKREQKTFYNLQDAVAFWLDQEETAVVLDEYGAFVEYEDLLRFI